MKSPSLAAFLIMALLAPRAGLAQTWNEETKTYDYVDDKGNVQGSSPASDKPADKPADTPAPDGTQDYAALAAKFEPGKVNESAAAAGFKPVEVDGKVVGFESPDGKFAVLAEGPTAGDAAEIAALGRMQDEAAKSGRVPKPGDADFIGPLPEPKQPGPGQTFCDANPGRPPCAPVEPKPEEIAEKDLNKANDDIAKGTQSGDVAATAAAIDAQRDAQSRKDRASKDALGTKGTGDASTDPGPGTIASTGGQNMGQEGRVGGSKGGAKSGGSLDGVEVSPDSKALAQSYIDMNNGIIAGALDGPSDPNVQSVAQVAQHGLGGRALAAAKALFGSLSESLGAAADTPETDLSDQLATSPIDGASANRAAIKVVECRRDTLDGAAGGRTSRRIGGC